MLFSSRVLSAALFVMSAFAASAVAPCPTPVDYTAPDGTVTRVLVQGNEYQHYYLDAATGEPLQADADGFLHALDEAGMSALRSVSGVVHTNALGQHQAFVPSSGSPKICVILVEFSDVRFSISDPAGYYRRALNSEGFSDYGHQGSVRDYFRDQSSGAFTPQFDVYGPVTLSTRRNYASSSNAYKMVHEAASALDSQVDFSAYDLNSNGEVNHVCIIFAGQGANFGASNAPWPHNSDCPTGLLSRKRVDGKLLRHYMCVCEAGYATPDGIGTFVHEFGHALGLPDLYNTGTIGSDTPNWWSVMDVGSYLDNSKAPCNYSAFERRALEWHYYTELTDAADVNLRPMAGHNFSCLIETGRDRDFYILENRPATGWDRALPGAGMLIWHIDGNDRNAISSTPNNNSSHLLIDLVRADNSWQNALEGDPWPGSTGNTSFTSTSVPAMTRWSSTASNASRIPVSGKEVTDIVRNASTGLVSFKFRGGNSANLIDPDPEPAPDPAKVRITVSASPAAGGKAFIGDDESCTDYSASLNELVRIHARPAEGYLFDYWEFNGRRRPYRADYLLTAEKSIEGTYNAVFTPDPAASITGPAADEPAWRLEGLNLTVTAPDPVTTALYTPSGQQTVAPMTATVRAIRLPAPGIYLLKINDKTVRLLARP